MAIALKLSTASQEVPLGPFVDDADGDTQMTALTIANTDIKIWKTGATTLANKNSGGATHISGGIYYCVLDATDTDTLGPLVIFVHVADALPVRLECVVLPAMVYDSGIAGTDVLQADVTQWNGSNVATPSVAGVPEVDLTHVAGATTDVSAIATNVAAILVDTGTTLDGRIPAALVSGRMDASVGAMAANTVTAAATAADFLAEVNAEVVDALNVDTYAEPGQGTPAATASLVTKIGYLYKNWRNRKTQTSSEWALYGDDAVTKDQEAVVADDGTTASKGEISTGA